MTHPAYEQYLQGVPDDMKPLVVKAFQEWDAGVEARVTGATEAYEPYKAFVENNIDPTALEQAMYLAQQMSDNPEELIKQAIEHYGLNYAPTTEEVEPNGPDNLGEIDMTDLSGLENHPAFQQIKAQAEAAQAFIDAQAEERSEQDALSELETYLEELHSNPENGEFDDLYVTALMAQGVDGEEAIKQFQTTVAGFAAKLNGQQSPVGTQTPPIVMGGEGNSGSGVPNETVDFSKMTRGGINDVVLQYLANNQQP